MPLSADDILRLYDRHAAALLAFAMRQTGDPEVAVDVLGETFVAAFADRRTFRGAGDEAALAWLYGIARHQVGAQFRRGGVERRGMRRLGIHRRALTEHEYERVEELAATAGLRDRVAGVVDDLPPEQRDAIRLRVVEERSYDEVARALGVTPSTARARVSRGLRALRLALEPIEETDRV